MKVSGKERVKAAARNLFHKYQWFGGGGGVVKDGVEERGCSWRKQNLNKEQITGFRIWLTWVRGDKGMS